MVASTAAMMAVNSRPQHHQQQQQTVCQLVQQPPQPAGLVAAASHETGPLQGVIGHAAAPTAAVTAVYGGTSAQIIASEAAGAVQPQVAPAASSSSFLFA